MKRPNVFQDGIFERYRQAEGLSMPKLFCPSTEDQHWTYERALKDFLRLASVVIDVNDEAGPSEPYEFGRRIMYAEMCEIARRLIACAGGKQWE